MRSLLAQHCKGNMHRKNSDPDWVKKSEIEREALAQVQVQQAAELQCHELRQQQKDAETVRIINFIFKPISLQPEATRATSLQALSDDNRSDSESA
jgi:hypothetical protein